MENSVYTYVQADILLCAAEIWGTLQLNYLYE